MYYVVSICLSGSDSAWSFESCVNVSKCSLIFGFETCDLKSCREKGDVLKRKLRRTN